MAEATSGSACTFRTLHSTYHCSLLQLWGLVYSFPYRRSLSDSCATPLSMQLELQLQSISLRDQLTSFKFQPQQPHILSFIQTSSSYFLRLGS